MPDPKQKVKLIKEEPKKFFNEPIEKFVNVKENRISARLHKQRAKMPKQKL